MITSATTIQSQTDMRLNRPSSFSLSTRVAFWNSDDLHCFCDVCGARTPMDEKDSLFSTYPLGGFPSPRGWLAIGSMHLCPDCAAQYEECPQVEYCPEAPSYDEEDTLDAYAAAQLPCSDDGTVIIPEGIRSIGYKAFMYRKDMHRVVLPQSVEYIAPFAFAFSALESFEGSTHLAIIDEKAFVQCNKLSKVTLDDELRVIGPEAFSGSAVEMLRLPFALEYCSGNAFIETPLIFDGPDATFSIAANSKHYLLDEAGALYAQLDEGLALVALLSNRITCHNVLPGTRLILDDAYAKNETIEHVVLPEGVEHIGAHAFHYCTALKQVEFPQTLHSVGLEAFSHTALERIAIPAKLEHMGPLAFDISYGDLANQLQEIVVDPGNKRFFMNKNLFCMRRPEGGCSVLISLVEGTRLSLSDDIFSCGPRAFTIRPLADEVRIGASLSAIHPYAFPVACRSVFRIELDHAICERPYALAHTLSRGALVMSCLEGSVNLHTLFDICDQENSVAFDLRERAIYALDRLCCPQFLTDAHRIDFIKLLYRRIDDIVVEFAKSGNLDGFERLAQLGFLNADNITTLIDRVTQLDNATATACLLDIKQRHFGLPREDFSL